jgi:aminoglycoside phosphotransferase (APT) family kinase protein
VEDRLHEDELPISVDLVRALVDDQFPHYANLPLTALDVSGSTNRLFRLGDELLVRLPRQPQGGGGIGKEQRWLPRLRDRLPVEIPEIVALGRARHDYPVPWSITRWLYGELPTVWQPGAPVDPSRTKLAEELASFISALQRVEVPEDAIAGESLRAYRGRPLGEFDRQFRLNLEQCRRLPGLELDLQAAETIWTEALELPGAQHTTADRWYHSDLVAENLLLRDGALSAVLDFGGLAIGDPTIDLHGAWELFDPPAREVFRKTLNVDEATWLRGRAWALAIALGALPYYWRTMPNRRRDRLRMARSVIADTH